MLNTCRIVCLTAFACLVALSARSEPLGLVINEDDSHFYGSRSAEEMTVDGLNALVDQYAGTKVSHLFLCPNAMRTSYDSDVWDAIWEVGDLVVPEEEFAQKWVANAKLLAEKGLDPYAMWIARCREKGISPWLSMRMNDLHNVDDPKNYLHSTFWLQHPEYWRVPGSTSGWFERALDYGIPEVREHHMKLVRELLERYDADGLELDWMRFGWHFKPGEEEKGRAILTDFMRNVRKLANEWAEKRGHPVRVGARVPAHPDAAVGLGMDGVTWAKEGLVDMLVPTPFWATTDFDIPMELWRERLGDAVDKVVLAAGGEILVRAHPGGEAVTNDIESTRGFAAAAWHRGAEQIYLFNYLDPAPMADGAKGYRTLLEEGLAPDVVKNAPRRHIVTYRDTVPANVSAGIVLPAEAADGPTFRINIGPVPEAGTARVVVGLAERTGVDEAKLEASLNGTACAASSAAEGATLPGAKRVVQFDCPLSTLREGFNEVAVRQTEGEPQQLVWVELRLGGE